MRLEPLENNLRLMADEGIRVTIDLMYGLPGQTLQEVKRSLQWAWQFKGANVQCLQTLLLPGTDLRKERRRWRMKADDRPPYGVRSTSTLSPDDIRAIEEFMHRKSPQDCMTETFVDTNLPDLFKERIFLDLTNEKWPDNDSGSHLAPRFYLQSSIPLPLPKRAHGYSEKCNLFRAQHALAIRSPA